MYTKWLNAAILLRKVNGVFAALFRTAHRSSGGDLRLPSFLSVVGMFAAVLIVPLVGLLLLGLFLHAPHAQGVMMAMASPALIEKRTKLQEKQKKLGEVFALAKNDAGVYDTTRKTVQEALGAVDSADAVAKIKALNVELDNIGAECTQLELKEAEEAMHERENARKQPVRGGEHIAPAGSDKSSEQKSLGDRVIESKEFQEWLKTPPSKREGVTIELEGVSAKTLFQTTAGYAPQSVRTGLLVEGVTRPIQVLDLIPSRPINQASDKYMEETTRTHAAAEKAEAATYAESTFAWTERTNPVQKITDSIPVTDEQLEDAPEVGGILDQRIRFGLRQRLDGQVFNGNGTAPNLKGILNVSGINTQAKGTDPVFDAIFKAMMTVRVTGRAYPSATIMHPTDWQNVRLTRTADGLYIMGAPSEVGAQTLFGLPVALCDAGSAGTAVTADFINFMYIGERHGIVIAIGYVASQFVQGQKTIRGDLRAVFTVTRPAAVTTITGL